LYSIYKKKQTKSLDRAEKFQNGFQSPCLASLRIIVELSAWTGGHSLSKIYCTSFIVNVHTSLHTVMYKKNEPKSVSQPISFISIFILTGIFSHNESLMKIFFSNSKRQSVMGKISVFIPFGKYWPKILLFLYYLPNFLKISENSS